MMSSEKNTPVVALTLLLAIATLSEPVLKKILATDPAVAQSPSPTVTALPVAPKQQLVRIDGSSSMETINEALKQRYVEKVPNANFAIAYNGTRSALQSLLDGKVDLAAIGRSLSTEEKAKGLTQVPVSRNKIAIIIGPNNPFQGSLTDKQFAQIFRGEITNWSQVGGAPGPIRFIDRPDDSDTRQAMRNYPVFRNLPFQSGAAAVKLPTDTTEAVIKELGNDGISYAIADQVVGKPNVQIVRMHKILPDDPRYPFSQPLVYVHTGNPSPVVKGFLTVVTGEENRELIEAARKEGIGAEPSPEGTPEGTVVATPQPTPPSPTAVVNPASPAASPEVAVVPDPGTTEAAGNQSNAWWGLVPLILLALLPFLLGFFRRRGTPTATLPTPTESVPPPVAPVTPTPVSTEAVVPPTPVDPVAAAPVATPTPIEAAIPPTPTDSGTLPTPVTPIPSAVAAAGAVAAGAIAVGAAALAGKGDDSTPSAHSTITLTPRDAHMAYTRWDASDAHKAELQAQGGENLMLRLYDVTGIDPNSSDATLVEEFDVVDTAWDRNVPIPEFEHDYVTEVGYKTGDGRWLPLVRSNDIRVAPPNLVDAVPPIAGLAAAGAVAAGAVAVGAAALVGAGDDSTPAARSTITLTPRDAHMAYTHWDAPDPHKAELQAQGGENLMLRLYDVTGMDPNSPDANLVEEFDVVDTAWDRNVPIPEFEHDYVTEVGYKTGDGRWLALARSNAIRVTPPNLVDTVMPIAGLAAGAAIAAGAVALAGKDGDPQSSVEAAKFDVGQTDLSSEVLATVDEGLVGLPDGYGESRIVLMPRDPQWAYAYWDVPNEHREAVRRQGGQKLALRIYDVTDLDINHQAPHNLQQYDCDEMARDWYVPIPVSDRDYIAEIGYLTFEGYWLTLARSNPCRIPPVYPSDWYEDQFITVDWDEDLRGKTFATLIPPGQKMATGNQIYDQIFGMAQSAEAMRVAGSLFGSMQHIPGSVFGSQQMVSESALSSYVFASGVGMMGAAPGVGWTLPTASGLTQSGVGIPGLTASGIGMSGIGFFGSMPPIRARKFWLIADAELIIYGATEPDAIVTIAGRPITLNPDGTFRFQMSFPDGNLDFPILAVAADGEQNRSIHMTFTRETPERRTNSKEDAVDESY